MLNAIVAGHYSPGQNCRRSGPFRGGSVSPAAWYAMLFARLEARGRVTRLVGSGTYVSMPTIDPREKVDSYRPAVREASPLEIIETDKAETAKTFDEFEEWDARLHHAIADASHNRMIGIYATITAARDQTEWGELKRSSITPHRRRLYEVQHRAIVIALRARDGVRAEGAALDHLRTIRHNLLGF